jgi:hypothetical protein
LPDIIRIKEDKMGRACSTHEKGNAYRVLVEKLNEKTTRKTLTYVGGY